MSSNPILINEKYIQGSILHVPWMLEIVGQTKDLGQTHIWNTRNILPVVISKIELRLRKEITLSKNTKFFKPRNTFLAVTPHSQPPPIFLEIRKEALVARNFKVATVFTPVALGHRRAGAAPPA